MVLLLAFLLLLVLPVAAALLFKSRVAHHIANDVVRIVAIGFFYLAALTGCLMGIVWLVFNAFNLRDMYPVVTIPIDNTYYFTQQEYGFATLMSSGYDLTFYRSRPFWLDQELGKVQLECTGKEAITATLAPARHQRIQLRIMADGRARLDTTLRLVPPFNFRRTFEDRTLDYAGRR